jgi:RNA polymerase sigma-70 factor (ECF subfamily)
VDRDERALVDECLAGRQDACTRLVDAHARMVGTVIWRATGNQQVVEDLAQETFMRVFRGLPYFDRRAKLSTWIYTIAHRVAIDHRRQTGRWREEAIGDDERLNARMDSQTAGEPDPETATSNEQFARIVREELAQLPDKYRIPLTYAAIDELDHATIAAMLGVQQGSVKTLLFRARALLKERIRCRLTTS